MKQLKITVNNKVYDVTVEVVGEASRPVAAAPVAAAPAAAAPVAAPAPTPAPVAASAGAGAITSPMAGVVLRVNVAVGQAVSEGQEVVVLEAMKMETPVIANISGTVKNILVSQGASVQDGQALIEIG